MSFNLKTSQPMTVTDKCILFGAGTQADATPAIFKAPPTFFTTPVASTAVSGAITAGLTIVTVTGKTQTLPDATLCLGKTYTIKSLSGVTTSIATTSSQTIDGSATGDAWTIKPLSSFNYQSDGSNWVVI
jgi:hypothetical protein